MPGYQPFLVALNLTRRCNLACAHCYLDAGTRDITRKIIEEVAAGRGHLEVNCKLLDQGEELGSANSGEMKPAMEWTAEAEKLLGERLADTPELAAQFMFDLLRADAEGMARETDAETITSGVLKPTWERLQTPVPCAQEARARMNDAPDFVRSGIKKAAKRFVEIRKHVEGREDGVWLPDHEMVRKMKNYLKEDKS